MPILPVAALVLSLVSVTAALVLRLDHQVPYFTMLFLIVAFGSAPLAVVLFRQAKQAIWTWAAVAVGLAMTLIGLRQSYRNDALRLLTMDFPVTQVVINVASTMAPVALAALGLVVLLSAAARLTQDRVIAGLAAVSGSLLSLVYAMSLLAFSARTLPYIGGEVERRILLVGALLGLATLLLPVAVVSAPGTSRPLRSISLRVPAMVLVLALLAGGGAWIYDRTANRIDLAELFPDPALAGCVASSVGQGSTSRRELDSVFTLDCNGDQSTTGRIRSLDGLENLPKLYALDVSTNEISTLEGLSGAPGLTNLKLTNNRVIDLAPVAGLTELRELGASNNRIADLAPIQGLADLSALGLSGNQIDDVSPLAGLTLLTEVDLGRNRITDVGGLGALPTLDRLILRQNQIENLEPLAGLTNLTMLDIAGNAVTDLKPLTSMSLVDELWIGGNPVRNLKPLRQMPALAGVDLEGSDPAELSGMQELRDAGVYVGGLA